ncbi:unnamed protein product [Oppiella nova]|uniref:Uncharacterized protein n=1 Tax=Oppiella nova TaxID=334625 RepID=A0A7R9M810_9ACAR|nr:unnamed protein product [Oppiella nova]CAG2171347.1 unnamed protein product [Oppiella nova]
MEIFIAQFIENTLLIATQLLLTMFMAFVVFNNEQNGSYIEVYLLLFVTGLQGMALGLLTGWSSVCNATPMDNIRHIMAYRGNAPVYSEYCLIWTINQDSGGTALHNATILELL